jgi:hypothetical protein
METTFDLSAGSRTIFSRKLRVGRMVFLNKPGAHINEASKSRKMSL